jgi:hypothetical protein
MARQTSVSLNDHFSDFIDEQVDKGTYRSASDVVRACSLMPIGEPPSTSEGATASSLPAHTSSTTGPSQLVWRSSVSCTRQWTPSATSDAYMKLIGSISTCTRRLPVTFSAEPSQNRT